MGICEDSFLSQVLSVGGASDVDLDVMLGDVAQARSSLKRLLRHLLRDKLIDILRHLEARAALLQRQLALSEHLLQAHLGVDHRGRHRAHVAEGGCG